MDPIQELSILKNGLIGQPQALNKEQKEKPQQQAKQENNEPVQEQSSSTDENQSIKIEKRSGEDRRARKKTQKRFDLRAKRDRRKSDALFVKI